MIKGISIYLHEKIPVELEMYLQQVMELGFNTVFTSIHIPESKEEEQFEALILLGTLVKRYGLELMVDISGETLVKICNDHELLKKLQSLNIDRMRFDCDYEMNHMFEAIDVLGVKSVVLNASTLNQEDIEMIVSILKERYKDKEIIACHNFYPQVETGLDIKFIEKQGGIFEDLGIPVISFLPSLKYARGPLYQGLVTVEAHRYTSLEESTLMLRYTKGFGGILLADCYAEETELSTIVSVCDDKAMVLELMTRENLSEVEKKILFKREHYARYDNGEQVIRMETSRSIASVGQRVEASNCVRRSQFDLTINNENYGRYSGELQIVLKDLTQDDRVNLVGYIEERDQYKIQYIQKGRKFYLK